VVDKRPVAAGVVLAGGSGTRTGAAINKAYLPLAGRRLVAWSIATLRSVPDIGVLLLVIRPEDAALAQDVLANELAGLDVEVVPGGVNRQGSELAALRHLAGRIEAGEIDVVLIHDAARPLASASLVTAVVRAARAHGGAIPGLPSEELVSVTADGELSADLPAGSLVAVQTPQGFRSSVVLEAYERAAREGFVGTDTASCVERFSPVEVHWVMGEPSNFKITYPEDIGIAEHVLASGYSPA
jgi:2-C-methyl-D-erythritol 4-phosphate cytidylyltransferase